MQKATRTEDRQPLVNRAAELSWLYYCLNQKRALRCSGLCYWRNREMVLVADSKEEEHKEDDGLGKHL